MRLLRKSLVQQIRQLTGAIFMIIFMIALIFMILKVLNYANQTQGADKKLLFILPLSLIIYLPHLLIGSVFLGTISTLNRWYQNHEMQVWMSLGLALRQFIPFIMRAVMPFFMILFVLIIWVAPWCHGQLNLIKNQAKQQQDLSFFLSGEFFEVGKEGHTKVLFVENIDAKSKQLGSVFINQINPDFEKIDLITAHQVKIENRTIKTPTQNTYAQFATLENGSRHIADVRQINNSELNLKSIDFESLSLPIQSKKQLTKAGGASESQNIEPNVREQQTHILIKKYQQKIINKTEMAELLWRLGLPFTILVLPILALAFTHQQVRKTKYWPIILGVVIYFAYNNLINLIQTMLEKEKIHNIYAIFSLHAIVFSIACLIVIYRSQGYLYFKSRLLNIYSSKF